MCRAILVVFAFETVFLVQTLQATIGNLTFDVIDTGGLDDKGDFGPEMLPHTNAVLSDADVVLFLIDARLGVTPDDEHFAKYVSHVRNEVLLPVLC